MLNHVNRPVLKTCGLAAQHTVDVSTESNPLSFHLVETHGCIHRSKSRWTEALILGCVRERIQAHRGVWDARLPLDGGEGDVIR